MSNDNFTRYNRFNNVIHSNKLIDIESIGNAFTSHNKSQNENAIYANLDRALANHLWLTLYLILFLLIFIIWLFLNLSMSNLKILSLYCQRHVVEL